MTDNNRAEANCANVVFECENIEQLAGLLSTQDFTKEHPNVAFEWLKAIRVFFSSPPDNAEALRVEELLDLLELIYDGYENGAPCYETSDGENGSYLGNAFKLDHVQEKQIEDILNKHRPRTAVVAAMKEGV